MEVLVAGLGRVEGHPIGTGLSGRSKGPHARWRSIALDAPQAGISDQVVVVASRVRADGAPLRTRCTGFHNLIAIAKASAVPDVLGLIPIPEALIVILKGATGRGLTISYLRVVTIGIRSGVALITLQTIQGDDRMVAIRL